MISIKNYMAMLKQFVVWVDVPIEEVKHKKLLAYLDHLLDRGLQPKTINCHLDSIRGFYRYIIEEEQVAMVNPVKRAYALRLSPGRCPAICETKRWPGSSWSSMTTGTEPWSC
jgi:site-specific recombinase XerD